MTELSALPQQPHAWSDLIDRDRHRPRSRHAASGPRRRHPGRGAHRRPAAGRGRTRAGRRAGPADPPRPRACPRSSSTSQTGMPPPRRSPRSATASRCTSSPAGARRGSPPTRHRCRRSPTVAAGVPAADHPRRRPALRLCARRPARVLALRRRRSSRRPATTRSRGASRRRTISRSPRSSATAAPGARSRACSTRSPTSSPKTSTWSSRGWTARRATSSGSVPPRWRSTSSARATTDRPATATSTSCATRCAASTCTRRGCAASSSPPTPRCRRGCASIPKVTIVRSEEFFADTSVAADAQLARRRGAAAPHPGSRRALPLLQRRHVLRAPRRAGAVLHRRRASRSSSSARCASAPATPRAARSGHDNALRVNRALLRDRFGRTIVRDLEHCATPLRRSVMAELEQTFAEDFARTAASRFRSATDISVTNSLYHYYALMTGRAVDDPAPAGALRADDAGRVAAPDGAAGATAPTSTCSASTTAATPQIPEEVRVRALRATLERMFPVRAPWERDEVSEARRSARSAHPSRDADGRADRSDPRRGEAPARLVGVDVLERAGRVDRRRRSARRCRRTRARG